MEDRGKGLNPAIAERIFEPRNMPAHGRNRHAALARCRRKAAGLHDAHQQRDVVQVGIYFCNHDNNCFLKCRLMQVTMSDYKAESALAH